MQPPTRFKPQDRAARTDRSRAGRLLRHAVRVKIALVLLVLLAVGLAYGRLAYGPLNLRDYSGRVAAALAAQLGPGWRVTVADTSLELQGSNPAVRASGLEIRNPAGLGVVRAPDALVSLDPLSLLFGRLSPRAIELRDLDLRARVGDDGRLTFATEIDGEAVPPPPPGGASPVPPPAVGGSAPSPVAQAVSSLLDPLVAPTGIVGSLDDARVRNARLTLVGPDGRERVGFSRVDATFTHEPTGARHVVADLVGPRGSWRITGAVRADGDARGIDLQASDVPLDDVMLLSGLSALPAGSDIRLSGSVAAGTDKGQLVNLEGRFESAAGQIARPGQTPVHLDRLAGRATWDETSRSVALDDLALTSGATQVTLAGALRPGADRSWRLLLSGRNATVAGAMPDDPAVQVGTVAGGVTFSDTGIVVDSVSLKGDALDVSVTGGSLPGSDGPGVQAVITATRTDIRRLFSLWPDIVNPPLRHYLTSNMRAGVLDRLEIRTTLDAADLGAATSGRPISDAALALTFALSDTRLNVIEGLPPLTRLSVTGRATGTSTTLSSARGVIEMPDGRKLDFLDGGYVQTDEHKPGSVADITFRVGGGADALASFLRAPVFRDFGSFEMDPNGVKGRVDLRAQIPLVVGNIPRASEMPLAVSGTLSDIAADRAIGRDRLENGQFGVSFAKGALAVHGDGKVGGSPAVIDLKQPKGGPIDATVLLTLDDAARSRRGLPSAPALTGPVSVKASTSIGSPKSPVRIEADLARASIDGVLPGWTKPAGRPGRLSLVMPEGDPAELRDVVVDSGTVQLRGVASMGADGALDHADLSTLKLSQGDDLRGQIDRSGGVYRVALKGNVADARPVLKWMTGSGGGGAPGGGGKGKDAGDVDVDIAINILTGHNDEALTGVLGKLSIRNRDVKGLALRGQFRGAPLDVQLAARREGPPLLTVQTADAGATLRFLDLYKRMVGGAMTVQTTTGDVQSGSLSIDNFTVRNEPAFKRIAAQTIQQSGGEDRLNNGVRLEGDQIQFTKLTGEFRRTASRVDYKDIVVWGAQAGFNVSGFVDYGRDRTDVQGTFIPAYGLNNAFSQLPLIGLILGGNRNEGLIAVDFRVSGQASSPTLNVNPLTVVAPGILRKFFGWAMPGDPGDTTGATTPRSGEGPRRSEP